MDFLYKSYVEYGPRPRVQIRTSDNNDKFDAYTDSVKDALPKRENLKDLVALLSQVLHRFYFEDTAAGQNHLSHKLFLMKRSNDIKESTHRCHLDFAGKKISSLLFTTMAQDFVKSRAEFYEYLNTHSLTKSSLGHLFEVIAMEQLLTQKSKLNLRKMELDGSALVATEDQIEYDLVVDEAAVWPDEGLDRINESTLYIPKPTNFPDIDCMVLSKGKLWLIQITQAPDHAVTGKVKKVLERMNGFPPTNNWHFMFVVKQGDSRFRSATKSFNRGGNLEGVPAFVWPIPSEERTF